ncbi:MAG: DnaA/Hda family protein [Chlamydiota bacterium]
MEAWQQFLSHLEQELGRDIVAQWLRVLKIAQFDAGNLYLEASDSFQVNWFEEHVRPFLKRDFQNNNLRPIQVHIAVASSKKDGFKKDPQKPRSLSMGPDALDPEMILSHFIPSDQNLMAYKLISEASRPAKGSPPLSFNPIYLYGSKKSGKTHLLMGAASALREMGKRVFYVRAEKFTEHVVQAIRLGLMQEFRKIYRDIDVLIVDDIHIFSRKNATQEEFFHTFNTLHTLGRLIILSANASPSTLSEIEPRLISRFEWGITASLGKPDIKPLLEKKASLWNFPLSSDLTEFLIEKFERDPILALQALSFRSREKGAVTRELALRLLSDLLKDEEKRAHTPEKLIKSLAHHYGIRSEDLLGKSQMREFALPRQMAMYLCREKLKMPFQKIGELFDRDHSTVMSSVKQIKKGIEEKKGDLLEVLAKISE